MDFATSILEKQTGAPAKVVYRAIERAESRGLIECGISLRSGWLTDKGKELVTDLAIYGPSPLSPAIKELVFLNVLVAHHIRLAAEQV